MAKIKGYIFVGIVCFAIGCLAVGAIGKGYHDRIVDDLSNQIASGTETNKRLKTENNRLTELNRQSTETIDVLQKQLADSYKQSKQTIDGIKKSLDEAASGLDGSGSDIQSVIDGLEKVKGFIRSLP